MGKREQDEIQHRRELCVDRAPRALPRRNTVGYGAELCHQNVQAVVEAHRVADKLPAIRLGCRIAADDSGPAASLVNALSEDVEILDRSAG